MQNTPGFVIAGTNSGCGKTTASIGIMAALSKRGLKVQPFKVGPDYIDPMFHSFITCRSSRNLDSWMLSEDTVSYLFNKNTSGCDVAVVEGVMGLYDGFGGWSEEGSTAQVSRILGMPVILVVNGEGASLSIAALIKGFRDFSKGLQIDGVIINKIKSAAHYELLKEIIEENTGIKAVGYLPKDEQYSLGSRHLGLVPSEEIGDLKNRIDMLAAQVERTIDLDLLLKLAGNIKSRSFLDLNINEKENRDSLRIAVARDKAFNFYYKDNLDLLETLGAELVEFSPLSDNSMPDNINGIYIGGGYPEIWAEELESNTSLKDDLKKRIAAGIPTYAECGGFMYLSESICSSEGTNYNMLGIIPGKSSMTKSLQRFGYVELEIVETNILAQKGSKIRAHEFHYSKTEVDEGVMASYKVLKKRRGKEDNIWQCGYKSYNLLAGYPHIHFWANMSFAEGFVKSCMDYRTLGKVEYR